MEIYDLDIAMSDGDFDFGPLNIDPICPVSNPALRRSSRSSIEFHRQFEFLTLRQSSSISGVFGVAVLPDVQVDPHRG